MADGLRPPPDQTRQDPAAEVELVRRVAGRWPRFLSVLDAPCGWGQVPVALHRLGFRSLAAADGSDVKLRAARDRAVAAGIALRFESSGGGELPFPSCSFDAVVCRGRFPGLPDEEGRSRAVADLCRVSRRYVLLAYDSPWCIEAIARRKGRAGAAQPNGAHTTSLAEVKRHFSNEGFRLVRDHAHRRFVHALHLALFERVPFSPWVRPRHR